MQLYYSNSLNDQHIVLDEIESRHCVKVLRKNIGDQIFITNGEGNLFETRISEITKKNVVSIIEKIITQPENPYKYCHIAIAPTKNIERFEWFLEKTTEIGIRRITPIISANSERKNIRLDRLDKILVSAMKQSIKYYKPILDDCITFEQFISGQFQEVSKYIAHCRNENMLNLFESYQKLSEVIVLIGPEGDFSLEEIEHAKKAGFVEISLGKSRLRTETAGVVACHLVETKNTLTGNLPG